MYIGHIDSRASPVYVHILCSLLCVLLHTAMRFEQFLQHLSLFLELFDLSFQCLVGLLAVVILASCLLDNLTTLDSALLSSNFVLFSFLEHFGSLVRVQ